MDKRDKTNDSNVDDKKTPGERDVAGTDASPTDMREANENIRKAQGEDSGPRPTIDRHR